MHNVMQYYGNMKMSKIFIIRYPGSHLGGRAVVRADNEKEAYKKLANKIKLNPNPYSNFKKLDPFKECKFEEIPDTKDIIYDWDGEY